MVPDIASKGHSFKGAMAYYLHDKREGDGPNPTTAERVEWTETRNLATDNPAMATRIMIATAKDADRLKAAAGLKNTGRKSNAHVYAYSLAWHPDEAAKLDRAEMVRAVNSSLKALGADHLQAVVVCHRDQKHPHAHVILNRVDPNTGKMHTFSNDRLILSDWANAYERERGQILTPLREEKRQLREQFEQADRRQHVADRPKGQPSPASMLRDLGNAQKVAHRQQWDELTAGQKKSRDAIYSEFGAKIAATAERHKADNKGAWAKHFRETRNEARAFDARERHFAGRIRNALNAVTHQQITGQAGDRGRLSLTFNNVLSSQARAAAFTERQGMTRAAFTQKIRADLDSKIAVLKDERSKALSSQRDSFTVARAGLIEKQDAERQKIREAWAQLKARPADQEKATGPTTWRRISRPDSETRKAAIMARDLQKARRANVATAYAAMKEQRPQLERVTMRDDFDRSKRMPAPKEETRTVKLSAPSPAPSPQGTTRPPERRSAEVPAVDRAAAWAKTAEGQKAMQQHGKPAPASPRKDWSNSAMPAQPTPAAKKDWNAVTADKPREIKPLQPRPRDHDRDR